ncbi:MAG: hypothetical protein JRF33_17905 [Deltaproteobacteria bacterium]|nr:hypothetical protein [Deltaproteobacteria bacterium]
MPGLFAHFRPRQAHARHAASLRAVIFGVCIVGFLSGLFACTKQIKVTRYRVKQGEGFLVVARHERQQAIITETLRDVVGNEIKKSGPGGEFSLSPALSSWGEHPVTYLIISKPGFDVYRDKHAPSEELEEIDIKPTANYLDEYLATLQTEYGFNRFTPYLDEDQKRQVNKHITDRMSFLEKTYPNEVAAAKKRDSLQSFKRRKSPIRHLLATAALADDGLAFLGPTHTGRDLLIVNGEDKLVAKVALKHEKSAALAREKDTLLVFDEGAIRRFDSTGKLLSSLSLEPAPGAIDSVTSMALVTKGILLGLSSFVNSKGELKPCRLLLYSIDGKLVSDRELPSVEEIAQVFMSPDGSIFVQGKLAGNLDRDVKIAGLKRKPAIRRGIIRLADWSAKPEVIITGIDGAVAFANGLLAYVGGFCAAKDHELVAWGAPGLLHQVLIKLSWDGTIVATYDVSDARVEELTFGVALDNRLVFFIGDDVFELDFGAQSPALP